jgi:hypothetical protein
MLGTQDTEGSQIKQKVQIKNGQHRDTGNIGHTIHRRKTNKTEGAIKNEQHRETGNIGHTRHRRKSNKTQKQKTLKR